MGRWMNQWMGVSMDRWMGQRVDGLISGWAYHWMGGWTPVCSEYHPSAQSPVVSDLSLTRHQLSGTNSLFLFVVLPLSVLFKSSLKTFLVSTTFSSVPLP